MKLMLTAFEPFENETINPSLEAARQMKGVEIGAVLRVELAPSSDTAQ